MPDPLMGFALQSFAPPAQPYAVSGALALLSSGRSPDPPEDHRARRRRRSAAPGPDDPHDGLAIEAPPAFRALLHTRVRHTEPAFYTGPGAWLSWAFAPPGCSPSPEWRRPSPRLPSWSCPNGRRVGRTDAPTGCSLPVRLARLSRGCRPSWGSPPSDLPRKFGSAAVRESPPQAPGCVTAPWSSHL